MTFRWLLAALHLIALGRRQTVNTSAAPWLATVCQVQTALVILMVILATGMARGVGAAVP